MDVEKACIYLDNQPFGLTSYQRSTTTDIVSRFSTGAQGETNLDLLKALSQSSFRGGMFHKKFNDGETVNLLQTGIFNDLDGALYFSPSSYRYQTSSPAMSSFGVTAWCFFLNSVFIACRAESPAVGNRLFKFDITTQAATSITLPAAINDSNCPITDLVVHGGVIFILGDSQASGTEFRWHRFDGGAIFSEISAAGYRKAISWRGTFYALDSDGTLNTVTNEFSGTPTVTVIKRAGQPGKYGLPDVVNGLTLFNNALYITKADGLFRYDGVDIATVFDYSKAYSPANFKFTAVFNGRFYYTIGSKIYEFDGITVTLLQDLTAGYRITGLTGGIDRLWICAQSINGTPGITNDKFFVPTGGYTQHLFSYNGVGFFENTQPNPTAASYADYVNVTPVAVGTKVYTVYPDGFLNASLEPRSNGTFYSYIDLAKEFTINDQVAATDRRLIVVSGDIDNGYPSVPKTHNAIAIDYEGFEATKSSIKIEAQYFHDGVWSNYTEIWNSTNVAAGGIANDYPLHEQASTNLLTTPTAYHRMRYRLTATIAANVTLSDVPRIRSLTMRYTLQPRMRRQWQLSINIDGLDNRNLNTGTIDDRDDQRHNNELRKMIYDAYESKKPLLFYDAEFANIKTAAPLVTAGTHLVDAGDVVALTNNDDQRWINRRVSTVLYDEVADTTTLTLDNYGARAGIGGAPSTDTTMLVGGQCRKSHAVYITQIANDHMVLDANTINDKNGYADPAGNVTIKLVEV